MVHYVIKWYSLDFRTCNSFVLYSTSYCKRFSAGELVDLVGHTSVGVSRLLTNNTVMCGHHPGSGYNCTKCLHETVRRPHPGPQTSRLRLEDICSTILLPPGFLRLVLLHRRCRQIFGLQPKPFHASRPPRWRCRCLEGLPTAS